ncbi:hypothetical protein [Nocardia sp. CDC160]|uniref:hypothetical protein n=1 Tax=Nocardia sp. CDC160 TaxID=3112166 RepID=UPI002DBCFB66|nr:hypothetical protein [Nocardia sp. CDC160]MEC3920622.1 hypothetical protein [Nocardia sp. CDC160]
MTVGAVPQNPAAVRARPHTVRERPAARPSDGTPGLTAAGEMSPRVLVVLLVLSLGVVAALIGGTLREGLNNPGGGVQTGTPHPSTTQPVNAQPPKPAPAPPPPAAPPVQMPGAAPQTDQYVAPAPAVVTPESAAAPPAPAPAAPPPLPDILAPILPFLLPPPPPPPPPGP